MLEWAGTGDDALLLEAGGYHVRRTDGAASFVETMRPPHITLWQEDALRDPLTETCWTTLSVRRGDPGRPLELVLARS